VRLADDDLVDEAQQAILNHSWVEHMPVLTFEQLAELLPVLAPVMAPKRRLPSVPKEYRKPRPKAVRVAGELSSSEIPALIRRDVLKRDEFQCQRCGRSIYGIRAAIQHRRPRQMGGSKLLHTMANLVLLCGFTEDPGTCTRWVEIEHREAAYAEGWLVPMGYAPEEWRVRRFGTRWEQPGDIWVPAKPHRDQADDESQGVA
jgi:hypothetical protein